MNARRFTPISAASGTIHDMLEVFESKLGQHVESSTSIRASESVYRDPNGILGLAPDETITYSELEEYWDKYHDSDPVLEQFTNCTEWLNNTIDWLEEVEDIEGCGSIQASTIGDMLNAFEGKLQNLDANTSIEASDSIDDKIWDIAQRYTSSQPLSGDWDTEPQHLLKAIIDETGLSEGEAKSKMIEILGWEPREVYQLSPLEASTNIQASDDTTGVGDDYINNLMDAVIKKLHKGVKNDYEVDNSNNILLTVVSDDDVVIEYTIPISDLQGDLNTDLEYVLDAIAP